MLRYYFYVPVIVGVVPSGKLNEACPLSIDYTKCPCKK